MNEQKYTLREIFTEYECESDGTIKVVALFDTVSGKVFHSCMRFFTKTWNNNREYCELELLQQAAQFAKDHANEL